jgi:hypothetical protein
MTNGFLGGTYIGQFVQLGRVAEATAVSFATGTTPANWSGVANAAGTLVAAGVIISLGSLPVSASIIAAAVTIAAGPFAQALYDTTVQHYPNLIGDALDSLVQSINDAFDSLSDAISNLADQALYWAGNQILDFLADIFHGLGNPLLMAQHDPIVLDLNGDGIALTSLAASTVHFDFGGDGFAERTGWVSPDDGILAIDDNGNGLVDNGLELFGSSTEDGFAVLEKLDTNGDGKIDAQDADFSKLRIWRDLNHNGISDPGELQSLAAAGITSISLDRQKLAGTNAGHGLGYQASFTRADGTTGTAATIYFQTDPEHSISDNTPNFTPSSGAQHVPQLPGSGLIDSIAYKATNDTEFLTDWTALTDEAAGMSPADLRAAFEALMLRWAGVQDVDPQSRGPFVDARHLAFVEKFFGDTYRQVQFGEEVRTYPSNTRFGNAIEAAFKEIVTTYETGFLAQVGHSTMVRGTGDVEAALNNPYFFYSLLDLKTYAPGDPAPDTPGNVGMVIDFLVALAPLAEGEETAYLVKGLKGLDGVIDMVFGGDRQAYAAVVDPHLAAITDATIREIATHIVDGTALFGSTHAEGINGTTGSDVFIGGGGGDVVSGGAGSDIYVYAKHDGDLWIRDDGAGTDTDRLVFTDLNSADVSLVRIGDTLLIKATATGKAVTVENFFNGHGIDILRFADGTELDRTHIKNASVFQGDGHSNAIYDSAGDDVIHGAQGDDLIHLGGGNDTILYGKGDSYDVVTDSSNSPTEHDTFILTDINSNDVELSRVGGDLILTVKSTGEYVDFAGFFPMGTGDWNITARNKFHRDAVVLAARRELRI